MWGRAGALCLSSSQYDSIESPETNGSYHPTKDRHKAPARPPHIPLSLQTGSDICDNCPIRVSNIIRMEHEDASIPFFVVRDPSGRLPATCTREQAADCPSDHCKPRRVSVCF